MTPEQRKAKAEEYYLRASMHLANANQWAEAGKKLEAERGYMRAQFWLDKANKYAGNN